MNQNAETATILEPAAKAKLSDITSLDSIVRALYATISGGVGVKRDWNRLRSLFVPGAQVIPLFPKREGEFEIRSLTVEAYIKRTGVDIEMNGFFEREISRKTERFGNLVHVFSTYEGSRSRQTDKIPFVRGINSIQLMFDGGRWWILSLVWECEGLNNPLPEKYLK